MTSRLTYVSAGVLIIVAGMMGKFGAMLSCIPGPVLGGINIIMVGMVTSLGLSYLESVDLHSSRNLLVLAITFFVGTAIPLWMNKNPGVVDTGEINVISTVGCKFENFRRA